MRIIKFSQENDISYDPRVIKQKIANAFSIIRPLTGGIVTFDMMFDAFKSSLLSHEMEAILKDQEIRTFAIEWYSRFLYEFPHLYDVVFPKDLQLELKGIAAKGYLDKFSPTALALHDIYRFRLYDIKSGVSNRLFDNDEKINLLLRRFMFYVNMKPIEAMRNFPVCLTSKMDTIMKTVKQSLIISIGKNIQQNTFERFLEEMVACPETYRLLNDSDVYKEIVNAIELMIEKNPSFILEPLIPAKMINDPKLMQSLKSSMSHFLTTRSAEERMELIKRFTDTTEKGKKITQNAGLNEVFLKEVKSCILIHPAIIDYEHFPTSYRNLPEVKKVALAASKEELLREFGNEASSTTLLGTFSTFDKQTRMSLIRAKELLPIIGSIKKLIKEKISEAYNKSKNDNGEASPSDVSFFLGDIIGLLGDFKNDDIYFHSAYEYFKEVLKK